MEELSRAMEEKIWKQKSDQAECEKTAVFYSSGYVGGGGSQSNNYFFRQTVFADAFSKAQPSHSHPLSGHTHSHMQQLFRTGKFNGTDVVKMVNLCASSMTRKARTREFL